VELLFAELFDLPVYFVGVGAAGIGPLDSSSGLGVVLGSGSALNWSLRYTNLFME
jgi:hypothetical protein